MSFLLDKYTSLLLVVDERHGRNLLHLAAICNSDEIIELLLKRGASSMIDSRDNYVNILTSINDLKLTINI